MLDTESKVGLASTSFYRSLFDKITTEVQLIDELKNNLNDKSHVTLNKELNNELNDILNNSSNAIKVRPSALISHEFKHDT